MLVSICVITYQRPEGLRRLIDGLNKLTFQSLDTPEIEVIVVDNDKVGSAVEFCKQVQSDFKWSLKSCIEPQRGISSARNRAIATASEHTDFVAMIDDDEVPEPSWLERLLLVQQKYDADVVSGPVLPYFQDDYVPNWVTKGNFFQQPRYTTGKLMQVAFTNNVLVRAEIFRKLDYIFDERFALTGGEDSHLFMRLFQAGYKFVWADEAIVHEWIPKSRTTAKFLLRRNYHTWSTHSLIEQELYPSIKVQAMRAAKGIGLILIGLILLIPSLVQGYHASIKALLYIFRGMGTLVGLLGIHYQEYKHIHTV